MQWLGAFGRSVLLLSASSCRPKKKQTSGMTNPHSRRKQGFNIQGRQAHIKRKQRKLFPPFRNSRKRHRRCRPGKKKSVLSTLREKHRSAAKIQIAFATRLRNCCVRVCFGWSKTSDGFPCSTMTPSAMNITSSPTSLANCIS